MDCNREQYKERMTKVIKDRLHIDMDKVYSIKEIETILDRDSFRSGYLEFKTSQPYTGREIVEALVYKDMIITDSIHKEVGLYENKSKCNYCNEYFDSTKERIFQISSIKDSPVLCEKCRREHKYPIEYHSFKYYIQDDDKEQFIREEKKYGIDYTNYIERYKDYKKVKCEKHDE